MNGGLFKYKYAEKNGHLQLITNINSKVIDTVLTLFCRSPLADYLSERWSTAAAVSLQRNIQWFPFNEDKTLEHLLLHWHQSAEIKHKMVSVGLTLHPNVKSVMYGLFGQSLTDSRLVMWWGINIHIRITRAKVIIKQSVVTGNTILKTLQ